MIYYNPIDNDAVTQWIDYNLKSCFIMTQLGGERPSELNEIISSTQTILSNWQFRLFDANSKVTGKDFLIKIWKLSLSVPLGIAIVTENMKPTSIPNIFYEIGIMNALGKETIVIKCKDFVIPSDFVRTEYLVYDDNFADKFNNYLKQVFELSNYYEVMADNLTAKPLLALDYLRRAYHITGDNELKNKAKKLIEKNDFDEHSLLMLKSAFKIK